jgi:hypothetical protein
MIESGAPCTTENVSPSKVARRQTLDRYTRECHAFSSLQEKIDTLAIQRLPNHFGRERLMIESGAHLNR